MEAEAGQLLRRWIVDIEFVQLWNGRGMRWLANYTWSCLWGIATLERHFSVLDLVMRTFLLFGLGTYINKCRHGNVIYSSIYTTYYKEERYILLCASMFLMNKKLYQNWKATFTLGNVDYKFIHIKILCPVRSR